MSAHCPHCKTRLSWRRLKQTFRCPACGTHLTAKTFWPWIATIGLWSFADIPIRMAIPGTDGAAGYSGIALRMLVSPGVGYAIGAFVIGFFCTVSIADTPHENV